MSKWIFVDVEATGRSPINGAMTEFGAVDYKTRQTFHGVIWESRPAEDNPAVSVITGRLLNPLPDVMTDFARWLEGLGKEAYGKDSFLEQPYLSMRPVPVMYGVIDERPCMESLSERVGYCGGCGTTVPSFACAGG